MQWITELNSAWLTIVVNHAEHLFRLLIFASSFAATAALAFGMRFLVRVRATFVLFGVLALWVTLPVPFLSADSAVSVLLSFLDGFWSS